MKTGIERLVSYVYEDVWGGDRDIPDAAESRKASRQEGVRGEIAWLFSDTPKGADASATVYTMVEMAKAHDLNIYKYLNYLLERLLSTKMSDNALSELAPWNQEVIANCSGAM